MATASVYAEQSAPRSERDPIFPLDDDLFSDLESLTPDQAERRKGADQPPDGGEASPRPAGDDNDRKFQRELGGEDLGDAPVSGPLEKVALTMERVQRRLAAEDTATETQGLQSRIVRDLDELLAQLQNQARQNGGDSRQRRHSSSPGSDPAGPGQAPPGPAESESPAGQSSNRLGPTEREPAAPANQDRLLEKAWGDLPAAERQQLRSARPEKFLPKYSRLIEDYFKRLAEDPPHPN